MKPTQAQTALQNIGIVVRATKMSGDEHDELKRNLNFVAERCMLADTLEPKIVKLEKELKKFKKPEKNDGNKIPGRRNKQRPSRS